MSTYIANENQTLLWNTIQKVGLFHETLHESRKMEWFKRIISMFYQQNINGHYDLRQLNKNTIGYMINSLRQEASNDSVIENTPPPEPNFKEIISDGVIENMDELLKQQHKIRELDNPIGLLRKEISDLTRRFITMEYEIENMKLKLLEPNEST